jgi:hypothetical protein
MLLSLKERIQGEGTVKQGENTRWTLEIPAGRKGTYRLAQLDDYSRFTRSTFPWSAPIRISLRARSSSPSIPGTWGFGLWNDPFGLALIQGSGSRFPALPNAAWFFFASDANHLSLQDDLPAHGQLAATFSSHGKISLKLLFGLPLFSLLFVPQVARQLRRWLRQFVKQDSAALDLDPTEWHTYEIEWQIERVLFRVDGLVFFETKTAPKTPLGLVIWVDNQYARWLPEGQIGYGTLANSEAAWLQVDSLDVTPA